jgi:hypothetical protein
LVTILLVIGFISTGIVIAFLVDVFSPDVYDKAESLAIGMTEQELIEIMGTRFYAETVNTSQIVNRSSHTTQDYDRLVNGQERVFEYTFYEKRSFGSQAVRFVGGIYLDDARHRIVFLQPRIGWADLIPAGRYEALLLLAISIALPWISLRLWCRRQIEKRRRKAEITNLIV